MSKALVRISLLALAAVLCMPFMATAQTPDYSGSTKVCRDAQNACQTSGGGVYCQENQGCSCTTPIITPPTPDTTP